MLHSAELQLLTNKKRKKLKPSGHTKYKGEEGGVG